MVYRYAYRLYLKALASSTLGEKLPAEVENWTYPQPSSEFATADATANSHGDTYRGAGVLIGILSILVIFIAVAPTGFQIENESILIALGIAKVGLMTFILAHVYFFGVKSTHHKEWIHQRQLAESLRYVRLKDLKESLATNLNSQSSESSASALLKEIKQTLAGSGGQIAYNRRKSEQYKSIEHFGEQLSWYGFAFALLCAIWLLLSELHMAPHSSLLIFGTAAVPALVAGIHGINGLLKIESLVEEHHKIAQVLNGLNDELNLQSASLESERSGAARLRESAGEGADGVKRRQLSMRAPPQGPPQAWSALAQPGAQPGQSGGLVRRQQARPRPTPKQRFSRFQSGAVVRESDARLETARREAEEARTRVRVVKLPHG
jgi:hypothetical protein